jgi:hypothetical protein
LRTPSSSAIDSSAAQLVFLVMVPNLVVAVNLLVTEHVFELSTNRRHRVNEPGERGA